MMSFGKFWLVIILLVPGEPPTNFLFCSKTISTKPQANLWAQVVFGHLKKKKKKSKYQQNSKD